MSAVEPQREPVISTANVDPNAAGARSAVLLFTDVVGSTELKSRLGTNTYAKLLARHNALFESAAASTPGAQILKHTGDGYFASFVTPADAVRCALRFQHAMQTELWSPQPLSARAGIHVGEVTVMDMAGKQDYVGLAADLAARVTGLAGGGQVLMTRGAFDDARATVDRHPSLVEGAGAGAGARAEDERAPDVAIKPAPPPVHGSDLPVTATALPLKWTAHGNYLLKGADAPVEIFEVSTGDLGGIHPPTDGDKARRVVTHDQEQTLGWRPAIGLSVPSRNGWVLEKKLGEGGFGEVWLARNRATKVRRVLKFCFDAERLRSFKRELTLFRLLNEALGDRNDIARLYEVKLDEPPFFLESEYTEGGNLAEWADRQGGIAKLPLERRIRIVAQTADAVAAAHSIGVLHKDIKPSNILINIERDGTTIQPRLADFGIGILTNRSELAARNITETGFTLVTQNDSSRTGTRLYSPPELLVGKPFTTQGDVYSLGVLLYQMVVADLFKPLAPGWQRDVTDELLLSDIEACVEGDPARRLQTAAELSRRLRSLDERRTALARQRAAERAAIRRQQLTRAMAAMLVIATGASAILAFAWSQRGRAMRAEVAARDEEQHRRADAEAARDRVQAEADKANAVVQFLTDMLTSADPTKGLRADIKVRDVIQIAAKKLDKDVAATTQPSDANAAATRPSWSNQTPSIVKEPAVEATVRAALGHTYLVLGLYPDATAQLNRGLDLIDHGAALSDAQKLKIKNDTAIIAMYTADYSKAEKLFKEVLDARLKLLGPDHADTGDSYYNVFLINYVTAHYKEALEYGQKALDARTKMYGEQSAQAAAVIHYLAEVYANMNEPAKAEPLYFKSLDIRLKALGPDHFEVGNTYANIGNFYMRVGDAERAETNLRKALANFEKSLPPEHPNVATVLGNLSNVLVDRKKLDEAAAMSARATAMTEKLLGPEHPSMAPPVATQALIELEREHFAEAERLYRRALPIGLKGFEPGHPLILAIKLGLGQAMKYQGRVAEGLPYLREAVAGYTKINDPTLAAAEGQLTEALIQSGAYAEAEPMARRIFDKAKAMTDSAGKAKVMEDAATLMTTLYDGLGKPDEAAKYRPLMPATQPATTQPAATAPVK